jgi:hypothetical protein
LHLTRASASLTLLCACAFWQLVSQAGRAKVGKLDGGCNPYGFGLSSPVFDYFSASVILHAQLKRLLYRVRGGWEKPLRRSFAEGDQDGHAK